MTTLTETVHAAEALVSEASGERSRASILVTGDNSTTILGNTVLGAVETGTPTATAGTRVSGVGGTVGDGTISAIVAAAGAVAGNWAVEMTTAGATAKFKVIKPDGTIDGVGTVGTEYDVGLTFTISDGAADFAAGDIIPISVVYMDGESVLKYEAYDQDGNDGSEVAAGILYGPVIGTTAGARAVGFIRDCEFNADIIVWPSDITADEKAVAVGQLLARGIVLR